MSEYVCRKCGNPVKLWYFGWKHCRGWHSKTPSCGEKAEPVRKGGGQK